MRKQQLRISYDDDVSILNIMTANRGVTSTSLRHDFDVIADLASEDSPSKVVGLEILNPTDYLPLGTHGYDEGLIPSSSAQRKARPQWRPTGT